MTLGYEGHIYICFNSEIGMSLMQLQEPEILPKTATRIPDQTSHVIDAQLITASRSCQSSISVLC